MVDKEAAAAGPKLGNFVATSAGAQTQTGHAPASSTLPPNVADTTLPEQAHEGSKR